MRIGRSIVDAEYKLKLNRIFIMSVLFFTFFSIFGTYSYKIYDVGWFIAFFIYELLFFLGLSSEGLIIKPNKKNRINATYEFLVTSRGAKIICVMCTLSALSFAYFIYLYRSTLGGFVFGTYTADLFADGRTFLEKITLLLMQIGGGASFLVMSSDKSDKHKKIKLLSSITLFLPGIRFLLMGSRFAIAVEFLMFVFVKWSGIKKRMNFSTRARRQKRLIIISGIILLILFMYLFSSRAISYTALEKKAFVTGDMTLKPFWRNLYYVTNGKIDFLCFASDYLAEAPYNFSYFITRLRPKRILFGQLTFRSIIQIINNLTGLGPSYSDATSTIASGQYTGFAYILIADFGVIGSFLFAYLIGYIFLAVERGSKHNKICNTIYPAIKVVCFFAPVFYFYVGRIDYDILFAIILSILCVRRARANE